MTETTLNSNSSDPLKALVKSALIELLQERPEEITDLLAEILEDFALAKAIEAGEDMPLVSREEILFDGSLRGRTART